MDKPRILLVEDEPALARVVSDSLEQKGYAVAHTGDGGIAYSLFQQQYFALCIVDVMLPTTDGYTLAQQVRAHNPHTPILFLTARTATADVVEGYRSGGNDYLKKPFSLEELFLRVAELFKRPAMAPAPASSLAIGRFAFNPGRQTLRLPGEAPAKLSYRETQLLLLLHQHRNGLLDRKLALMTLWGEDSFFHTRTMDVFMTRLRKHLRGDATVEILNVRGLGYKLVC